jgi:hypothetical protein
MHERGLKEPDERFTCRSKSDACLHIIATEIVYIYSITVGS